MSVSVRRDVYLKHSEGISSSKSTKNIHFEGYLKPQHGKTKTICMMRKFESIFSCNLGELTLK